MLQNYTDASLNSKQKIDVQVVSDSATDNIKEIAMQLGQSVKVDHLENKGLYLPEATEPNAVKVSNCVELKETKGNANSHDVDVPNKDYSATYNDDNIKVKPGKSLNVGHFENKSVYLPEAIMPCTVNVSDCGEIKTSKSNVNSTNTNVQTKNYSISANDRKSGRKQRQLIIRN